MMNLSCSILDSSETESIPTMVSFSSRDKQKREKYIKVVRKLLDFELDTLEKAKRQMNGEK